MSKGNKKRDQELQEVNVRPELFQFEPRWAPAAHGLQHVAPPAGPPPNAPPAIMRTMEPQAHQAHQMQHQMAGSGWMNAPTYTDTMPKGDAAHMQQWHSAWAHPPKDMTSLDKAFTSGGFSPHDTHAAALVKAMHQQDSGQEGAEGAEELAKQAEEQLRRGMEGGGEVEVRHEENREFRVEMPESEDGMEIHERDAKAKEEIEKAFEMLGHHAEARKESPGVWIVSLLDNSPDQLAGESAQYGVRRTKVNRRKRRLS